MPENNDLIGGMRNTNRAARAAILRRSLPNDKVKFPN